MREKSICPRAVRFNIALKKYYQNHKEQCKCRTNTYSILNNNVHTSCGGGKYIKLPNIPKVCKKCGSIIKVEIHHELYPQTRPEIIKAILEGKIYYLCFKCHGRKKTHKFK